jgi:hypothetical protein
MGQYLRLSFGGKIFFGYAFRDDGKALARMRGWDSASGATGWPVCVLAGLFARDEGELPRAAAGGLGISAFAAALNRPYSPPLSDLPVGGLMFETHRAGAGAMCRECCRATFASSEVGGAGRREAVSPFRLRVPGVRLLSLSFVLSDRPRAASVGRG